MEDYIKWNDNYSVGIEKLDLQHKQLVEMINKLHNAMREGKGKNVLDEIINGLMNYAVTHFNSEEELFKLYHFPDEKKHVEAHENFIREVQEFKVGFDSGKLFLSIEIMEFLKDWLIKHILAADKEYTAYLNAKGVQ